MTAWAEGWKNEMRLAHGGLMRCCIGSLSNQLDAMTERPADGTVLDCEYETPGNGNLILDGNTWRWNRERHWPEEPKP